MLPTLPLLVSLAAAATVPLDDAHLVADLDARVTGTASANAELLARLPGGLLAVGTDREERRALWFHDDTTGTTQELATLPAASASAYLVGVAGGRAYLRVGWPGPDKLWATDGTVEGTLDLGLAADDYSRILGALPDGSAILSLWGEGGTAVWRSDGSIAGTRRVAGAVNPDGPSVAARDGVFFVGYTARSGGELWYTNGSRAGTRRITDLVRGPGSSHIRTLVRWEDEVLFIGSSHEHGELWRSDGSAAGTHRLADLGYEGPGSGIERRMFAPDGLGFVLFNGGYRLWRSDGTEGGTFPLDTGSGAIDENSEPAQLGSQVYFGGWDQVHGGELWRTDGTAVGTSMVTDVCPGPCNGFAGNAVVAGNHIGFVGYTPGLGRELWTSTGSAAGTHLMVDRCPGTCDGIQYSVVSVSTTVYFTSRTSREGPIGLSRSRGTRRSTQQLLGPTFERSDASLIPSEGGVCFAAEDSSLGGEIWCSKGTAASTRVVADLNDLGFGRGSQPHGFASLGPEVVFVATNTTGDHDLWRTDASTGSAQRLATLVSRDDPTATVTLVAKDPSRAYFRTDTAGGGHAVWATAGDAATSQRVWTGSAMPTVVGLDSGPTLIFADALYTTDGSPQGTAQVTSLSAEVHEALGLPGRRAVFPGDPSDDGSAGLWTSDGTTAGTYRVSPEPISPSCFTGLGLDTLFVSATASSPAALWVSDGRTQGSTRPIAAGWDVDFGCAPGRIATTTDRHAYFALTPNAVWMFDGQSSRELATFVDLTIQAIKPVREGALIWAANGFGTFLWFAPASGERAIELAHPFRPATSIVELAGRIYFTAGGALDDRRHTRRHGFCGQPARFRPASVGLCRGRSVSPHQP